MGLRHIDIEPSRLESTCLLLARGVDLFYGRLAPAKVRAVASFRRLSNACRGTCQPQKYDSLEDDFSYGLLVIAIVALTIGSAAMHFVTGKSMLAAKWK